jgi:hypothetical protein
LRTVTNGFHYDKLNYFGGQFSGIKLTPPILAMSTKVWLNLFFWSSVSVQ